MIEGAQQKNVSKVQMCLEQTNVSLKNLTINYTTVSQSMDCCGLLVDCLRLNCFFSGGTPIPSGSYMPPSTVLITMVGCSKSIDAIHQFVSF